jgi:hypothetical protein
MTKTKITLERHETLLVRSRKPAAYGFCPRCGRRVQTVTPEQATKLTATSLRQIFHQIEAHELHFKETSDGLLVICLNSLLQRNPI